VDQLEVLVKQFLTKEAISRYGNLKSAHPEQAIKALAIIAQLIEQNQIKHKLTDQEFKAILVQIQEKKTFNIKK